MTLEKTDSYLRDWTHREELAEKILPLTGALYREHGVVTTIYGVSLVHKNPIEIIKAHRYMRKSNGCRAPAREVPRGARDDARHRALAGARRHRQARPEARALGPARRRSPSSSAPSSPSSPTAKPTLRAEPQDVVLYGFGRIGRLLARILIDKTRQRRQVPPPRDRRAQERDDDLEKRASLLRRDSVHGPFEGSIQVDRRGPGARRSTATT